MGLLTTYDGMNINTTEGLAVRYSCAAQNSGADGYVFTRYATKNYSFVGMDHETAEACAQAKIAQYTRSHRRVNTSTYEEYTIYECLCSIAVRHTSGKMWSVSIAVTETDEAYALDSTVDPASLFATENARDYDEGLEGSSALTLSGASCKDGSWSFSYSQDIGGFNRDALVAQYKTSSTAASWSSAGYAGSGKYSGPSSSGTVYWRLVYGSLASNVYTYSA